MPFNLVPEQEQENTVVKTFRIRPSDGAEVERVARLYNMEPTRFVRRIVLMGLDAARQKLTEMGGRA